MKLLIITAPISVHIVTNTSSLIYNAEYPPMSSKLRFKFVLITGVQKESVQVYSRPQLNTRYRYLHRLPRMDLNKKAHH